MYRYGLCDMEKDIDKVQQLEQHVRTGPPGGQYMELRDSVDLPAPNAANCTVGAQAVRRVLFHCVVVVDGR